jgi:hypothetical protein
MISSKLGNPRLSFFAAEQRGFFYSEALVSIVQCFFFLRKFQLSPTVTHSH